MQNSFPGSFSELLNMMGNARPELLPLVELARKQEMANAEGRRKNDNQQKSELKIRRLEKACRLLLERNNLCAAALGACPDCWGTDILCTICRGQGNVASQYPDQEAFSRYVAPVLERFGSKLMSKDGNTAKL